MHRFLSIKKPQLPSQNLDLSMPGYEGGYKARMTGPDPELSNITGGFWHHI